ncbi:hypothetical protein [Tepidibacter mesophilus]|uniref:hypothetical protein n=1 Tax=Tepidibacter mesophilus TaxID=655607 RepID=UPI000C082AFE|nr:hypothetical protein [Tepidibacter mesophilus]
MKKNIKWIVIGFVVLCFLGAITSGRDMEQVNNEPIQAEEVSAKTPINESSNNNINTNSNSNEVSEYAASVNEVISEFVEANDNFSKCCTQMGENPSLLMDQDFILNMAMNMGIIKNCYTQIKDIAPPSKMENVHTDVVDAFSKYDKAMDIFGEGVDNMDVDKINQATQLYMQGTDSINNAQAKLLEVGITF